MEDKDIERIDYIIDRLIKFESTVGSNDLHRDGYYEEYNDNEKKIEQDFSLLMLTLDELGILDKVSTKQGDFINYTPKVLQFKKTHGSFKNYCEKIKEKSTNNETESRKEKERQDLKDEIDRLTKVNLELQNRQMKMYIVYSIIAFVFGAIITNVRDILILLNIMSQE